MTSNNLKPQELNTGTNYVLPGPQVKGMIAGTPNESAYIAGKQNGELLSSLSKVGGRKKRVMKIKYIHKGGASGSIVVPTIPVSYNDQMVGQQSATGQMVGNANTLLVGNSNSKYDNLVSQPAPVPASQYKRGGSRKSMRIRKSRKSKKSRKTRKTSKSKK